MGLRARKSSLVTPESVDRRRKWAGPGAADVGRIASRYRWWLSASVLALITFAVWGKLAYEDFGSHLLAECVGISASIPVTVLVVEAILDRRRDAAWASVRVQTGRSIEALVQQAAFDFHVAISEGERHEIPSPAVLPKGGHAIVPEHTFASWGGMAKRR
jgi:hypothetical protein